VSVQDGGMILVVDDNETSRYAKARTLRIAGFQTIEAGSGTETLRRVAEQHPRLVILDVQLPDFDGWEVCRRLKQNPATASVPVLQISATFVSEEDTVRALEGGADACLTEPVEPPVLVATVRALLRARAAEDSLREALGREQLARNSAESANRAKDEFLALLSHELRSPLGAILTWVTLLRQGSVDAGVATRGLEAIERNARLQVKLIEDLLDVSRIVTGKTRLDLSVVELPQVVSAVLESVGPAAIAKGVRFDAFVDPNVGTILGDPTRLQQTLWNLLSNAIKFTPKGGWAEMRVERCESHIEIRVTDSGKGIDPAFLPYIFERFRQADSSMTRSEGGLGLGLAIVRHVVELHGGTVEASSPGLGQGATFMVRLPIPALRPAGPLILKSRVRESAGAESWELLDGLHLLVVDDEGDAREAIGTVLQSAGADVVTASSVREALEAIHAQMPDVVVSDIAMPLEDGFTLIREIRSRVASSRTIRALALTAYAGEHASERVSEAGFDSYLTKPIEAAKLVSAVASLAERPRPRART
jgi:signal transduction histidine kinase/BarA-like signal transduction histidine kinase